MQRPTPRRTFTISLEVKPEQLPHQLEQLASHFKSFQDCLNEFPEIKGTELTISVFNFGTDLGYFASCLKEYDDQLSSSAVQRYIHERSIEIRESVEFITADLASFVESGFPIILYAQQETVTNLLNLSTVATFFTAVTATTLQNSFERTERPIDVVVNLFWYGSLVFSIASAVNSLLGLTWEKSPHRSPNDKVHPFVMFWVKRSPLIFLVISILMFSAGLACFCIATQPLSVAMSTLALTSFTSCGLGIVSIRFVLERWASFNSRGKQWLGEIIDNGPSPILEVLVTSMKETDLLEKMKDMALWSLYAGQRISTVAITMIISNRTANEGLSTVHPVDEESAGPSTSSLPRQPSTATAPIPLKSSAVAPASVTSNSFPQLGAVKDIVVSEGNDATAPTIITPRKRFMNAVRKVVWANRMASRDKSGGASNHAFDFKPMKYAKLVPALKNIVMVQQLAEHQALVRHLEFSPDGKWLATCSWDRTARIWKVPAPENANEKFSSPIVLAHANGFLGQVAWSPDTSYLLTKTNRQVKIWTKNGVCKKTIDRPQNITAVTWLPQSEGFLSVEGSSVNHLELHGKIQTTYTFDSLELQDVAITSNGERILCVANLLHSKDDLRPAKWRPEKRIIVYNLAKKSIEHQMPVLREVSDITISRDGLSALVCYENEAPSQIWRIEMLKKGHHDEARLSLIHTYLPKTEVSFAGPGHFGGTRDELVLCPTMEGEVLIWDRQNAILLHSLRAGYQGENLTGIACNHASLNFMFASGAHDGTVRIWTQRPRAPPPTILLGEQLHEAP